MQKLRCVVERITFQNPENGYSVMKVKVKTPIRFKVPSFLLRL